MYFTVTYRAVICHGAIYVIVRVYHDATYLSIGSYIFSNITDKNRYFPFIIYTLHNHRKSSD